MTRWVAAPLVALTMLTMSAWLGELEDTTELSARLAKSSESAPGETKRAAEEVEALPQLAELTTQQAHAFHALAEALDVSAERVVAFNDVLRQQRADLGDLAQSMSELDDPLDCVESTLVELRDSARRTPSAIGSISATLGAITGAQNKAIRHLQSINRKLAALGVLAGASGVEAPPGPRGAPVPIPTFEPSPLECE